MNKSKPIIKVCETMDQRFKSGNDIPVERTHIRKDEWDVLMEEFQRLIMVEEAYILTKEEEDKV